MNLRLTAGVWGVLIAVLFFSGCTNTSPPVQTQTPVPTTAVTLIPTPTAVPFPGALALNEYATFGSGERQGIATVYQFEIKSDYNWTSPSWNSPGQQASASQPLGLQRGYTTEKPGAGNAFLFLYVRVMNNGTGAVYAPSAQQFVVSGKGKVYNYTPVRSPDVVIDKVAGTQYDYQIGRGGEVGYIQPGESNRAEGYLIYEIPAALTPREIYVLVNLDYQNQAVWSLAETNA
jgi:hypothetical protein